MEEKNRETVFRIRRGGEHGLYISRDILDPGDLMFPAYRMALSALAGIVRSARRQQDLRRRDGILPDGGDRDRDSAYDRNVRAVDRSNGPEDLDLYGYPNNIIAFCAGRGQGKTSAMLSFTRGLDQRDLITQTDPRARFYVMPPIDPTVLEDRDCVMEVILSRLFHESERLWKDMPFRAPSDRLTENERMDLLRRFQKCLNGVHTLHSQRADRQIEDPLESLYRLGESFDLRTEFYHLIRKFFSLSGRDPDDDFLVVPIDDTDLQFSNAYNILEETRKFLSLPNIVVVMAADLDQLRLLVIQHYYDELKGAAEQHVVEQEDVRRMAAKYLDKLIPSSHAIFLPRLRARFERDMELPLEIEHLDGQGSSALEDDPKQLQDRIFHMIRKKTGLVFTRHRHYMHELIPETLRGVQHLHRLLDNMLGPAEEPSLMGLAEKAEQGRSIPPGSNRDPKRVSAQPGQPLTADVWKAYCRQRLDRTERLLSNLTTFQNYFINDWCSSKLSRDDWDTLKKINEAVAPQAVKYAAVLVRQKIARREAELSARTETELRRERWRGFYEPPSDADAPHGAERYADLQNSLNRLREDCSFTLRENTFGFAVNTLFSIRFNRMALEQQKRDLSQELRKIQLDEEKAKAESGWRGRTPPLAQTTLFAFDYHRIRNLLAPKLFDSEQIQKEFTEKTGAPFLFCAPLDTRSKIGRSDAVSVFYRGPDGKGGVPCCDLLHCFYSMLYFAPDLLDPDHPDAPPILREDVDRSEKYYMTPELQERILRAQDLSLYVCCNWDVQDQIVKAILHPYGPEDRDSASDEKIRAAGDLFQNVAEAYKYTKASDLSSPGAFFKALDEGFARYFVDAVFEYLFRFLDTKNADPFGVGLREKGAPPPSSTAGGGSGGQVDIPKDHSTFTERFIYPPCSDNGSYQLRPLRHMRRSSRSSGEKGASDGQMSFGRTAKEFMTSAERLTESLDHLTDALQRTRPEDGEAP